MSKEKTLKERLASLESEIESLKYACTRLSDILEQDLKIRLTEEQHLSEIHNILERFTKTNIILDPKVLQSIYAMTTNALNDTGLVRVLHKLDDVLYRLSERLKEFSTVQKEKTKQIEKMIKEVEDGVV
jgi:ribosomal protein L30/L7E